MDAPTENGGRDCFSDPVEAVIDVSTEEKGSGVDHTSDSFSPMDAPTENGGRDCFSDPVEAVIDVSTEEKGSGVDHTSDSFSPVDAPTENGGRDCFSDPVEAVIDVSTEEKGSGVDHASDSFSPVDAPTENDGGDCFSDPVEAVIDVSTEEKGSGVDHASDSFSPMDAPTENDGGDCFSDPVEAVIDVSTEEKGSGVDHASDSFSLVDAPTENGGRDSFADVQPVHSVPIHAVHWDDVALSKYISQSWICPGQPRNILLAMVNGFKVTTETLKESRGFLPDEIINAYMEVLCSKFSISDDTFIPCATSVIMFNKELQKSVNNVYNNTSNRIFTVFNYRSIHWMLLVIERKKKILTIVDPLGESQTKCRHIFKLWISYLQNSKEEHEGWTYQTLQHSKQQDSTSCGIYCLKFAELIMSKQPLYLDANLVMEYRCEIFKTVLNNQDQRVREFCRVCHRKEPSQMSKRKRRKISWIGCDNCENFWSHEVCEKVSPNSLYLCDICKLLK